MRRASGAMVALRYAHHLVRPHWSACARNPRLKAVRYKSSSGKLLDNRAASADIRNALERRF